MNSHDLLKNGHAIDISLNRKTSSSLTASQTSDGELMGFQYMKVT